ncbi:MAG TPA: Fur family transcriptional regulator [Rhodocyclaceae bacterium]|nr:transcriptional repressor [Rhodocyclaceae bacterium]HMV52826.1 Fur family transcriptional regulator [Rhodocyclaceae bacterium]HMZ82690.1 Fur family transcriptional regulator [Rhodocyclaceae bacterium]HNA02713.1 Fur family transcriptional regulator [Rhodocyclaceae bacterium]HNB77371.1 Fur family transcriptional regulator [Rhodocyclaceae bacterium]
MDVHDHAEIATRLRAAGIPVTLQRLAIAGLLFREPIHITAEQLLKQVKRNAPETSRATIYNTLRLFAEKGLIKELVVQPERVVFDSNTQPHHHLYNAETGELTDLPADAMKVVGLPPLPEGTEIHQVDVIVRIRRERAH